MDTITFTKFKKIGFVKELYDVDNAEDFAKIKRHGRLINNRSLII